MSHDLHLKHHASVAWLLAQWAHAIDDDRVEEIAELMRADGRYTVSSRFNVSRGLPLSIIDARSAGVQPALAPSIRSLDGHGLAERPSVAYVHAREGAADLAGDRPLVIKAQRAAGQTRSDLLLNPADVFRILNVFSLDDVRTLYGLTSIVPPALAKPWLMGTVMAGWIVVPLGLAGWRFKP